MNRLSRRSARSRSSSAPQRRRQSSGAGLVLLCGLIYGLVGFLVTALPPMPWLWPVVLLALGLHIWAISLTADSAPPRRWWGSLGSDLLQMLAALGITLPLAVALNYLGSDQLNDITIGGAVGQVILFSLVAVVVTLLCRWITSQLGHRLIQRLSRRKMRGVLALIGIIGLALGGTLGVLVA